MSAQGDLFAPREEPECTCINGYQYEAGPYPTTGPENCPVHAIDWAQAQRRPSRVDREMERLRLARALPGLTEQERELGLYRHRVLAPRQTAAEQAQSLASLLDQAGPPRSSAIGHDEICARIDEAALVKKYGPNHRREFADEWDALRRVEFPEDFVDLEEPDEG